MDTKHSTSLFLNDSTFSDFDEGNTYIDYENRLYAQDILRRVYYFVAQALLEQNQNTESSKVLNKCIDIFPNEIVPYKQYAFAIGKLFYRAGNPEKGKEICLISIKNLKEELEWITSFDPPNPIISVQKANRIKNMYAQMLQQYKTLELNGSKALVEEYLKIEKSFSTWKTNNWPY